MKKHKYSRWTLSFGAIGGVIGIILSQLGDFSLAAVLGGLSGALLLVMINIIYVKKKSDETPEFDERTIKNMQTFYFYATNIFFAVIFIILTILLSLGINSIATSTLLMVFFAYFVVSGIIALIVSNR